LADQLNYHKSELLKSSFYNAMQIRKILDLVKLNGINSDGINSDGINATL